MSLTFAHISGQQFEHLCVLLLQAEGFDAIEWNLSGGRDRGFDLLVSPPGSTEIWVAECKLTDSLSTLRRAASDLSASQKLRGASGSMLITSAILAPQSREELVQRFELKLVWDRRDLEGLLDKYPSIKLAYAALISSLEGLEIRLPTRPPVEDRGEQLAEKLSKLPRTPEYWQEYEKLCAEILSWVFSPHLRTPRIQSWSEDGLDRRDAVFPIRRGNDFWDNIYAHHRARMVVAEFKNSGEQLDQVDVESIAQYLYPNAMRSFGVLCGRVGASKSALKARRRTWQAFGGLIVFLFDEDLKELLARKARGEDPTEVIDDQLDLFFLELAP